MHVRFKLRWVESKVGHEQMGELPVFEREAPHSKARAIATSMIGFVKQFLILAPSGALFLIMNGCGNREIRSTHLGQAQSARYIVHAWVIVRGPTQNNFTAIFALDKRRSDDGERQIYASYVAPDSVSIHFATTDSINVDFWLNNRVMTKFSRGINLSTLRDVIQDPRGPT